MLTTFPRYLGNNLPKDWIDCGYYLPWVNMPLYRIDWAKQNAVMSAMMAKMGMAPDPDLKESKLFNIDTDNDQLHPITDPELETKFCRALVQTLRDHQAPEEQITRLALEEYI